MPTHFLQRFDPFISGAESPKLHYQVASADDSHKPCPTIESTYLLNKISLINEIGKLKKQIYLVSEHASEQAARHIGKPVRSFDSTKDLRWDNQMGVKAEQVLSQKVLDSWETLKDKHPALCLHGKEAVGRLDDVIAFIQFDAPSTKYETLHDKPWYMLARSVPIRQEALDGSNKREGTSQDASSECAGETVSEKLIGLVKHKRTLELMLALDRLFSHKELYP